MAFTYKIFNSRTGEEVAETKEFEPTDPHPFAAWLDANNTCYEPDDIRKPANDACDYEMVTYNDGVRVYFNPATGQMDLTEEIIVTPEAPAADDSNSVDFI